MEGSWGAGHGASRFRPEFQRLLRDARARRFDVVVCEALDRLGRKLADIADLHDQVTFLGIAIHSVQQGPITPMHIGLLGTMSQLFLADLRAKTTRGLRAVAEDGRSAGGLCYGYRVVVDGGPGERKSQRGRRVIDEVQGGVVRRIFKDYGSGLSPRRIAMALNAEGIPSPRGGAWAATAINGNRANGTGILNNELYVGRQIWGRQTWLKDPSTGRRLARSAAPEGRVVSEVPDLRIVSDEIWEVVRARQRLLDRGSGGEVAPRPFWSKQRPRYLFSGLMRCASCGGGFSKISVAHFGCSTARNKGETQCTNLLTLRHDRLEREVLEALKHRMMDPEIFREFVAGFTAEWNRLQSEASAGLAAQRQELARVGQQIERAVDAIVNGSGSGALQDRLLAMEGRKKELEKELASAAAPAPRLHPGLAQVYRDRVAELTRLLAQDDAAEARELIRGLVEQIRLVPEGGALRIEVRGALGAILALAEGAQNAERPGGVAGAFWVQIKDDAGTRNRRSHCITVRL